MGSLLGTVGDHVPWNNYSVKLTAQVEHRIYQKEGFQTIPPYKPETYVYSNSAPVWYAAQPIHV